MSKMKRFLFPCVLVLLGACMALLAGWDMHHATAAPGPDVWVPAAVPIPVGLAANLVQCPDMPGSFYLVGGIVEGNITSNTLYRYDIATPEWVRLADLPAPRRAVAATCYQGRIYAAGGVDYFIFNSFYIYDIGSDSWTSGPDLPDIVWGAALGAWDGKLYLAGGTREGDPYTPVSRVDVFDIASNVWTVAGGHPMPTPTASASVQAGPYLYMVGGQSGDLNHNVDKTQRYDMRIDTWQDGPTFTSARALGSLAITGSSLYMLGGDLDGGTAFDITDMVEVLDLSAWPGGVWADLGDPLPVPNLFPASTCSEALAGGEIWDIGGVDANLNAYDEVYYRPTGETCPDFYFGDLQPESLATSGIPGETVTYTLSIHNDGTLPDTYDISASAVWNTTFPATVGPIAPGESAELLVSVEIPAGGAPGESDTALITATSQGDPSVADMASLTTSIPEWMEATSIPHPTTMSGFAQCIDDPDHFYVIGGADDISHPTRLVWRYEISTDTWEPLADYPAAGIFTFSTCYQDRIYSFDTSLFIYDIATDTWTYGPPPPRFASGNALGVWDGKLFVVGGNDGDGIPDPQVDIYDITNGTWLPDGGADMLVATEFSGWVQAGPYLYISGGWLSESSDTDVTQRYNMATDSWEMASATLPTGMGISGLVINGQKLYNIGGNTNYVYTPLDQVLVMDLTEWPDGTWEPYNDFLPFPNSGMAPFCTEGKTGGEIWSVAGGYVDEFGNVIVFDTNLYHPTGEPCVHYGVDLSVPIPGEGWIGQQVEYPLTITNTGTITDYFNLTISTTWGSFSVLGGPGPVGPGDSIQVIVGVQIPENVHVGDQGLSVITVASLRDPVIMDTALITTTVTGSDVHLNPDSLALSGFHGETITYTLTVSNMGTITDTVNLTYTGNTWVVLLPVTSFDLGIGESAEVVIYVTIPEDAQLGDSDALTLTATSAFNPFATDSSTLTTTAFWYRTWLPLTLKD